MLKKIILFASVLALIIILSNLYLTRPKYLIINNKPIKIEIAQTQESQQKGLSGRQHLVNNSGMLFWFNTEDKNCFWMKDMKFPLDIVWISSKKEIVDIKTDINPDTYPKEFCPNQNSQYVLETNSGQVSTNQIQIGDLVKF